jgi:hypothetical protein
MCEFDRPITHAPFNLRPLYFWACFQTFGEIVEISIRTLRRWDLSMVVTVRR